MSSVPPPPPRRPQPTVQIGPVEYPKAPLWQRPKAQIAAAAGGLIVALTTGLLIGVAVVPAPKDTAEYRALANELASAESSLAEAQEAADAAVVQMEDAEARVVEIEGDIPARETTVAKAEKDINRRETQLASAEKDVARRERAVGVIERDIKRNTIAGDGVYEVGRDMAPGTYRSTNNVGCYYALTGDSNGEDIISNHFGDGQIIATVTTGRYFSTQGCSKWILEQ